MNAWQPRPTAPPWHPIVPESEPAPRQDGRSPTAVWRALSTRGAPNSIRRRRRSSSRRCSPYVRGRSLLTSYWIRDGHGPRAGGISGGGRHFHHYNLGIALLSGVGAVGLRGSERRRRTATATAYGSALALIDEFALLLDLKNVYWSSDGRKSVDAAVIVIASGATVIVGLPFWRHARRALLKR